MIFGPSAGWSGTAPITFSLTYLTSGVSTTDTTSYSFASQTFGTADANRYIIAALSNRITGGGGFSSCTLGGVAATQHISSFGTGGADTAAIWSAPVPTGTTGTVAFVTAASAFRGAFGIWRLVASTGTPTATANDLAHSSAVYSASLTIPTGGGAIGYVMNAGASARTWTWANLTENFDATVEGGASHSGAMSTTAGTPTITVTASNSLDLGGGFVLAAFGP